MTHHTCDRCGRSLEPSPLWMWGISSNSGTVSGASVKRDLCRECVEAVVREIDQHLNQLRAAMRAGAR